MKTAILQQTDSVQTPKPMTFNDICVRKQEVLGKIRREQSRMKYLADQLVEDYHRPLTSGLFSVSNVKRVSSLVGGVFYAYQIVKSLSRVTGLFCRR
jgi:hypothetical protein